MVLINDKKYACATCIKGHRSSSCTHNERPLFEVKRKGRPVTQCLHCRQARRDKALHVKCECAAPTPTDPKPLVQATEKPAPAAKPFFPNGFKDVHAMNEAAEALHALTRNGEDAVEAKVRKVDALLNPCKCLSGGKCNCCRPRAKVSSGTSTPYDSNGQTSTDKLADMFSTVSTASSSSAETNRVPPQAVSRYPGWDSSIRVGDTHHPAHTSPYVHKAKLYSPYSPNVRHPVGEGQGQGKFLHRPPVRGHASSSSSVDNTLPSIRPLNNAASRASQLKDLVLPSIISFPTAMEITLDGCTCGDGCACPGCAVHPQSRGTGNIEGGKGSHAMDAGGSCPTSCTSCFDCRARVSVPAGIPTIDQLITVASSAIPAPAHHCRPSTGSATPAKAFELDGLHTSVVPAAVLQNEKAAEAWGLMRLKPLECCNGCGDTAEGEPMQVDGSSYRAGEDVMKVYTTLGSPSTLHGGGGGCCAKEKVETETSRTPSVMDDQARPELVPRSSIPDVTHSSADATPLPAAEPKSCCAKDTQDPVAIKPKPCAPPALSRSASTSKPHSTSHTPKPILPRPAASTPTSGVNAVSTIQTKNGAKHQLILPTSSRTIQVEKSLQRRASGRRPTNGGKSGAVTPNPGLVLAGDGLSNPSGAGDVSPAQGLAADVNPSVGIASSSTMAGNVSPHTTSANDAPLPPFTAPGIATPQHQPFNNHAFDPLLLEPLTGYDFSGQVTPIDGLDGGIWDLIDDGERWILPSAPPPDDFLGEFAPPEGYEMGHGMLPPPRDNGTEQHRDER